MEDKKLSIKKKIFISAGITFALFVIIVLVATIDEFGSGLVNFSKDKNDFTNEHYDVGRLFGLNFEGFNVTKKKENKIIYYEVNNISFDELEMLKKNYSEWYSFEDDISIEIKGKFISDIIGLKSEAINLNYSVGDFSQNGIIKVLIYDLEKQILYLFDADGLI
ncbi:MAG: hypothetical protein KAT32_04485 [Candidatus Moranbacteria bacterium]|nr:hypothetical protein [Candidatus Moranbacteria bacterium]